MQIPDKTVIPVVTGTLEMIKKGTKNFIDQISTQSSLQEMQKIVLTSIAHIPPKSPLNLKCNIYKERHITLHLPQVSS